ncbi:hypothetical protein ACLI1A_02940 [Flavobacterium sp. RHBU_3]
MTAEDSIIRLSESQIFMLNMSEDDIQNNKVLSQDDLDRIDLEWLRLTQK